MPNHLSIRYNESFVEFASQADSGGPVIKKRFFISKTPLNKATDAFWQTANIKEVSQATIILNAGQTLLRKRLGHPPCLLITQGFENWLDMNLPAKSKYLTMTPIRVESPLDQDNIFGINERVNAEGSVLTPIADSDLEFLAAKLKMNKVSQIAICFLHSHKNSENEVKAAEFLESQGFQVEMSHKYVGEQMGERRRWLPPILSAYLKEPLQEILDDISKVLENRVSSDKIWIAKGQGRVPLQASPLDMASLLYGDSQCIVDSFKASGHSGRVFYCGLDNFFWFDTQKSKSSCLNTELGPISLKGPKVHELNLQPTSSLNNSFWGTANFSGPIVGYEPGPMCFGRGLTPTFLDFLNWVHPLVDIEPFNELVKDSFKNKFAESVRSYFQGAHLPETDREMFDYLCQMALLDFLVNLSPTETNYFCGPLGERIVNLINKHHSSVGPTFIELDSFGFLENSRKEDA